MKREKEEIKPIVEINYDGVLITKEIVKQMGWPERVDFEYTTKPKALIVRRGIERRMSPRGGRVFLVSMKGFCDMLSKSKWFPGFGDYEYEVKDDVLTVYLEKKIC